MKTHALILLAAATAAVAQPNRSFERGKLTAYKVNDGPGVDGFDHSEVVQVGVNGELPTHGAYMAQLRAGELSMQEAADVLGMDKQRLIDHFVSLGGSPANQSGDYNVLQIDLPAGDYAFDFRFTSSDPSDPFLDHAFVVNGAGQITALADNENGPMNVWQAVTVSHPGGQFAFVCANGADNFGDAHLFIDDTFLYDVDNGSFETGGFDEWTIHDAGSGDADIINPGGGLIIPTHGSFMARLAAGDVTQADAEMILGLEPGRLAQLYTDLGGIGDATAGDYLIISQPFGGSSVSMDIAFATDDVGSPNNLDHAFTVDSEGVITVLDSTIGLTPNPSWQRITAPHAGGEFFIVVANGGSTDNDPLLFLDDVREGPAAVDSSYQWGANQYLGSFGADYFETFGQIVPVTERSMLEHVKFYIWEHGDALPVHYRVFVYEWDGDTPTGEALFESPPMSTDGVHEGGEAVLVETPGVVLERDRCYIAFLTTLGSPSGGSASIGLLDDDVVPGHAMHSDADDFASLVDDIDDWYGNITHDLAFEFEFAPLDAQVVPNINQFVDGPSINSFPWGSGGDFRYQQLYSAAQFNGRGGEIDSFAYRVANIGDAFGPVDVYAQIWMGYSYLDPGQLDPRFAENWQFGKTLVHDGPVTLSSNGLGGFDVVVDFDGVFNYDPAVGNLLMEVVMPFDGQPSTPYFDSAGYAYAVGGTPWTDRLIAGSADADTGILIGNDGHVTRFNFVADPEPYDPDCNGDGVFNILDFVCFQIAYDAGDVEIADCNGDGVLNILDFVCFQTNFQDACF